MEDNTNNDDMVLSPEPISYLFPTTAVEPQEEPESSTMDHSAKRKQRDLSASKIEKTWRVSFRLLQCQGISNSYILEMHEAEANNVIIHQLLVREKEVQIKILSSHQSIIPSPRVHIVNPIPMVQARSKLSLRERLAKWTIEQRKHNNSERRDKFYSRQMVLKKFRSLQEVATFILFNCYKEDLRNPKEMEEKSNTEIVHGPG